MQSIKTSVNLHRILEFAFRNISLDKLLLSPSHRFSNYQITKGHFGLSERNGNVRKALRSEGNMTAALPLHSHALAATAAVEWEERKKDTGSGRTPAENSDKLSDKFRARARLYIRSLVSIKSSPSYRRAPNLPGPICTCIHRRYATAREEYTWRVTQISPC